MLWSKKLDKGGAAERKHTCVKHPHTHLALDTKQARLGTAMPALCARFCRTVACGSGPRITGLKSSRLRSMAQASTSAFIDPDLVVDGAPAGILHGKTFAVKDMYDIAGHPTGFGNPVWLHSHPVPSTTATAVQRLLDAGASVRGKTHMDELAYSLNGENHHYGTPVNAAAPGRIPGGSSSGSASACAAGLVDFALGSDTGGSVRIPASYCGLFGFRPTHGRIPIDGGRPLAPSFDSVGHFARDGKLLKMAGQALLGSTGHTQVKLSRWLLSADALALAQGPTSQALRQVLSTRFASLVGQPAEVHVASGLADQGLGQLTDWFDVFRICQAWEIWQEHGEWVSSHQPNFGPGISDRFKMASQTTKEARDESHAKRMAIKAHVDRLLLDDGVLIMPTAPGPAPLVNTPGPQLDAWRKSMISLTSLAGLCGLPQVSVPAAKVDGLPVGLSLVGPAGSDEQLLELAESMGSLL